MHSATLFISSLVRCIRTLIQFLGQLGLYGDKAAVNYISFPKVLNRCVDECGFFRYSAGITVISHLSDLGERISRRDTARTDGPAKEILTEQAIGMKVPITFHQTNFLQTSLQMP